MLKVGGVGMPVYGFGFDGSTRPRSTELADAWKPYVETAIELFGPDRCMFESNFPVDKQSFSYDALWNVFKLLIGRLLAPTNARCCSPEPRAASTGSTRDDDCAR